MAAAALPASATWLASNSSLFELSLYQRWEYLFFFASSAPCKKSRHSPNLQPAKHFCAGWRPLAAKIFTQAAPFLRVLCATECYALLTLSTVLNSLLRVDIKESWERVIFCLRRFYFSNGSFYDQSFF